MTSSLLACGASCYSSCGGGWDSALHIPKSLTSYKANTASDLQEIQEPEILLLFPM
jgi:hypothetical protein